MQLQDLIDELVRLKERYATADVYIKAASGNGNDGWLLSVRPSGVRNEIFLTYED